MTIYKLQNQRKISTVRDGLGHEIVKRSKSIKFSLSGESSTQPASAPCTINNEGAPLQAQMSYLKLFLFWKQAATSG